jgi:non-ribosomal peptide synthase protein (TIGR01720 family)
VEETLARVWADILGIERVGIHDNFFELGGDSILSIQVVARAARQNLSLTPRQLFQRQTIAELATAVETEGRPRAEQAPVVGPLPLTPIQRWFFEEGIVDPHHFNHVMLFRANEPLDADRLKRAFEALLVHHDALRLRFEHRESGMHQRCAAPAECPLSFTTLDLGALALSSGLSALADCAASIQASLNLAEGPLLRVVLFRLADGSDRLLVVIHHLAVDGVSWRILVEDVLSAYGQLAQAASAVLPPKTTSYREWAERLVEYARSGALDDERPFWRMATGPGAAALPREGEGENDFASMDTVLARLSAEDTAALLSRVPRAYRTQINDVLLTALVQALRSLGVDGEVLLDLEGHGREDLFDGIDLSRTVGWFTSMFPVRLSSVPVPPGDALMYVKDRLRAIPNRGIGYGVARYLGRMEAPAFEPEIGFNYLGQLDPTLGDSSPIGVASDPVGPIMSPRGRRPHVLDVSASVGGGELSVAWMYCRHHYRRSTIENLASAYLDALRALIAHCLSPDAGGVTPSDFPLAGLDADTLHRLVGRGRNVEDIYPLSPLQSGMLFHCLSAPEWGLYMEQLSCTIDAPTFDGDTFRQAWVRLAERHPVLRTGFLWDGLAEPLQVVHREVSLEWNQQDWRDLPESAVEDRMEAFLEEDRRRGFELKSPPLMRLAFIRLSEQSYRLIWSHHHLLIDGWSLPVLLRELMALHAGLVGDSEALLPPPRPYADYIAWLRKRDSEGSEAFWRTRLAGFRRPTPLLVERQWTGRLAGRERIGMQELVFSREDTAALENLAKTRRLTLGTIVQGAWALLLSHYSGEQEVVYGMTVSGRSAPIPGIESMVGLFINMVPVRVEVRRDESLVTWLASLQQQLTELRHHEHSPLVDVTGWSDVPRGVPMFESIFVFENYPVELGQDMSSGGDGHRVTIRDIDLLERTNYPLGFLAGPGEQLVIKLGYDRERFDDGVIARALEQMSSLLVEMPRHLDRNLGELPLASASERRTVLEDWATADSTGEIEEALL